MSTIVTVNASPRTKWNTTTLVQEAARGARETGAEVLVPTLMIMTSNAPRAMYAVGGYAQMIAGYKGGLSGTVGPTKVMVAGDTLQVSDYDRYNWTMFDPQAKQRRRGEVFPKEMQKAFMLGKSLVEQPWK